MSEIHLLVRVVAKADKLDVLTAEMLKVQAISRAEPGCVRYDFLQDIEAPTTIYICETYTDKDAFKSHARSEHMAAYLQATGELVEQVNMHKVAPLSE